MRFRKFLNPYKTRDSSFREYTEILGGEREERESGQENGYFSLYS